MSKQDLQLKVTLSGDGRQLSGTLKTATGEVQQFGSNSVSASATAAQSFQAVEQHTQQLDNRLGGLTGTVMKLGGAWLSLQGINSIISMADDYGQMAARIEMATTSVEEFRLVQERLQETAGGTYRRLEEAQELYIQTADALRNLGYATEQQLDITDSLSYLFVTNATSADRAQSSINAFSRSMMTGKVTADDWNSMLMATPTLVNAIAESTGKTTAEIRELGVTGKLALADLTEGLRLSRDENQRLSDGMALTVDDALVRLRGNFTTYIGELNASSGATATLAEGIATVAENIDTLATVTLATGVAAAGRYGISLAATTAATVKDTLAKRASAAAELQLAQAQVASTAAALRNAQAQTGLIAGHGTAAKAADAHAASLVRLQAAQQNYIPRATAATVATNAWRGSLALLGGPAGIAIIGSITAITYAIQRQRAQAQETVDLLSRLQAKVASEQAERNSPDGLQRRLEAERQALLKLEQGIQSTRSSMEQLRSLMNSGTLPQETLVGIAENYQRLQASLAAADDQMEQHRAEIDALESALEQLGVQTGQLNAFGQTTQQSDAISKITEGLVDQIHQLQLGERAYLDYQLAQQNATAGQRAQALAAFDAAKALRAKIKADEDARAAATAHAASVKDFADSVLDALDPLREIEQQMELVWAAFDAGHLDDSQVADYVDHLIKKLKELDDVKVDPLKDAGKGMGEMASGINSIAGAMQGMYESGDRGYKNMAIAMQAANVIAAVGAVLTQGMGDPYTAFARMAAMAASVAALGYSVGSVGGSAPDDAARRQAQQGTGTVFGDTAAKSESIANAVEITANASRELVGINRDMLKALQETQRGIAGASNRIVTNTQNLTYDYGGGMTAVPTPQNIFDKASDLFGGGYGLLGLDRITAGIFKLGAKLLGGKSEVTDQGVELIGGTMAEMIENTMMRSYETTRSRKWKYGSWKESTGFADIGEEPGQQVQAVFKSIADSVYAGATDLGLAGVDVQAAINSFAIDTQKISLKGLTAEEQQRELEAVFSSIFDRLAGHVISSVTHPLAKAGEGLGETLARVGANVNVTREAAYRLGFQLHHAAGAISEVSVKMVEAAGGMEQFISSMSGFVDKFAPDAHKFYLASTDMQRALSAVGLTVPSTRDEFWQLMQTLNAGTDAGRQQIATLLRLSSTADSYYKQLDEQQAAAQQAFMQAVTDAMGGYFADLSSWAAEEQRAIETDYRARISMLERQAQLSTQIGDYVAQLRLSDLSPAAPAEKLAAAGDEFAALLVRAQAGDLDAASKLQGAADTYLKNADAYYGRTDIYTSVFEDVATQLEQLGIGLGAASTEEHIASLNEQMLSEQQQVRAYLEQELDWAVSQYDKLTDIEQLLDALPSGISSSLQQLMQNPEQPITVAPIRPDGSHFNGLKRVPFDGYIAELHKDEAVLTAAENRALARFDLSPLQSELAALRQEVAQLRAERARDAAKAEQQRNSQTDATETLVRVNRTPVKMT